MQFSLSSKYASNNKFRIFIDIITWIIRLAVGATFIFSGFVKAIDPWGTLYKFQEYFAAIGIPTFNALILTGVFALCAVEFIIGVSIFTGCYRKSSPILALIFMCFMLPLTLWIAIADPVKDCGCFGDFLILSNWATFWKNVVLTLLIIWLIKFNNDEITIISPAFQWIQVVCSMIFLAAIMLYGYFVQPLLDFRPYPVGEEMVSLNDAENEEGDDGEEENFIFIYEKDGVKKEFTINDDLPSEEDGWNFVERKIIDSPKTDNNNNQKQESRDKTFRIWDKNAEDDMTPEAFTDASKRIVILIPDLANVSPATTWKINSIYDTCQKDSIDMFAVVSGSAEQIKEWEDLSMPQYEIYSSDDTAIKEVARGNPAIVYIKDGKIVWKTSLSSLDFVLNSEDEKFNPDSFKIDSKVLLFNLISIYLICLAVLVAFSMIPRIKNAFGKKKSDSETEEHKN